MYERVVVFFFKDASRVAHLGQLVIHPLVVDQELRALDARLGSRSQGYKVKIIVKVHIPRRRWRLAVAGTRRASRTRAR